MSTPVEAKAACSFAQPKAKRSIITNKWRKPQAGYVVTSATGIKLSLPISIVNLSLIFNFAFLLT